MGLRSRRRPRHRPLMPAPAPGEPEYRPERPILPYAGPRPPDEWRAAWAEAIANDPDTRAMLGRELL